ncbi:hypothetical protein Anapl_02704 [Anas platyrhynchos]|uniref:Uncharacterized protein n=1 Tax=Anas platyrhynchos TaxID=8839 RepID=R0KQ90_ANAPL|nr:hypothetical protein Anapl_02704 [Anas platyrhynchos]
MKPGVIGRRAVACGCHQQSLSVWGVAGAIGSGHQLRSVTLCPEQQCHVADVRDGGLQGGEASEAASWEGLSCLVVVLWQLQDEGEDCTEEDRKQTPVGLVIPDVMVLLRQLQLFVDAASHTCSVLTGLSTRTMTESFNSHSEGASAINMHQVLEEEGGLLFDHSNVVVTLKNILTTVYMELVLFQVLCPLYCGDVQTFPNNRETEKEMQMIAMCYSTKARDSMDIWSLVRGKLHFFDPLTSSEECRAAVLSEVAGALVFLLPTDRPLEEVSPCLGAGGGSRHVALTSVYGDLVLCPFRNCSILSLKASGRTVADTVFTYPQSVLGGNTSQKQENGYRTLRKKEQLEAKSWAELTDQQNGSRRAKTNKCEFQWQLHALRLSLRADSRDKRDVGLSPSPTISRLQSQSHETEQEWLKCMLAYKIQSDAFGCQRESCLASPLVSPLQASCWQEASAGGQLSVFSEQAGPCRGSVVLGQCDGRSEMDVHTSAGCHHKTSPTLT